MEPPIWAIWNAASLPLGSIIPKYRFHRDIVIPCLSSAVVPLMQLAYLDTCTFTFAGSMLCYLSRSSIVMKFIILVRLAISLFLKVLFP